MSVRAIMGDLGRERGERNEGVALDAARSACDRLPWVTSARAATREEDARGIDIIVATDIGSMCLQVKSSRTGAQTFRASRPGALIEVVIATPVVRQTEARIDAALHRLRARIMKIRGGRA